MSEGAGRPRARLMLGLLLVLLALWCVPWADVLRVDASVGAQSGAERTGMPAMAALLVAWGLGATLLVARGARGLRLGAAGTEAGLALAVGVLLARGHAWIPGGHLRASWIPVFLPLGALALLEAATLATRSPAARGVAALRAWAALVAVASLGASGALLPAALAAWHALSPLALRGVEDEEPLRRRLYALLLLAAVAAVFAPPAQARLVDLPPVVVAYASRFAWTVVSIAAVLVALDGVWRPPGERPPPPRPVRGP
jgi:hypothetical protein